MTSPTEATNELVNLAHMEIEGIEPALLKSARERLEQLYAQVGEAWPGFIARAGQYQMMHAALLTFLQSKQPEDSERKGNNLAQIEAGTGTGKTVAYCLAAIVASEFLKKTVIVSTATVALQEQLFHKDLPRLAKIIPTLRFDILKGRGRYICDTRLNNIINDEGKEGEERFDTDFLEGFSEVKPKLSEAPRDNVKAMRWFKSAQKKLHDFTWDGELDSLEKQPDTEDWRQVQASAQTCNGGACESYKQCPFFKARRRAATATLQVANHALILATLQTESLLINPGESLFVFDEAHHLPTIAADQYSYRIRLGSSMQLLGNLRAVSMRHARLLPASTRPDPVAFGKIITDCLNGLTILEEFWTNSDLFSAEKPNYRFPQGAIPEDLIPHCTQLALITNSICKVVAGITEELSKKDEEISPTAREENSRASVEMGTYLSRLQVMENLFMSWATHDNVPWAKWMEYEGPAAGQASTHAPQSMISKPVFRPASAPDVWLCASPMTAAQILAKGLWKNVSAAVCTSATLTACGSFDFFDRLSGMNRFPERRALVVCSPFDYMIQGELRIPKMKNSPKNPGFSDELCATLPTLLRKYQHGQLVLFTSKRQMKLCHAALPRDLLGQVQVQGDYSRSQLLKTHGERVGKGERSIIFGLQSFGEGIDLPGELCEHVVIDKIPFTPPSSPVDEALCEWLTAQGRDPFNEISVPRAAMKLAQWAGRGVRTESDRAVITICDTRLGSMRYGKSILAGMPPFPVIRE